MPIPKNISVAGDVTSMVDFSPIIMTLHDYLSGVTLAPGIIPNMELAAPMFWPPGVVTNAHNLTSTVFHRSMWIVQKGHDLGAMLAHIPQIPDDLLAPIHMLNSSRKATFSASSVKADDKEIALCTMLEPPPIPTPMNPCSTIPMPVVGTWMSYALGSVEVGMTWGDVWAGAASLAADAAWNALGGDWYPSWGPNPFDIVAGLFSYAIQDLGGDVEGGGSTTFDLGVVGEVDLSITRDAEGNVTVGLTESPPNIIIEPELSQTLTFGDEGVSFTYGGGVSTPLGDYSADDTIGGASGSTGTSPSKDSWGSLPEL